MGDNFPGAKRSDLMSRIRSAGNKATELRLIQVFRTSGITGWRRGSKLPGRPDFVFPKLPPSPRLRRTGKTALFVDGCFWHGCPRHFIKPKGNAAFWRKKIQTNRARDRKVNRTLRSMGWKVARVWEHELKRRDEPQLVRRLMRILGRSA
jgi:DNA mismatch endonuclease, patch repair protein